MSFLFAAGDGIAIVGVKVSFIFGKAILLFKANPGICKLVIGCVVFSIVIGSSESSFMLRIGCSCHC